MNRKTILMLLFVGLASLLDFPAVFAQQQSQTEQEASAQQAAKQQDYLRARATCLEAKGYSVK